MERLDLMVALGFIERREQRFNAAEQTQAHDLSDHTRMHMPAAKGVFVVELLNLRESYLAPRCYKMRADAHCSFISALAQKRGTTVMVNRVHVLHGFAAANVSRDDVRGVNSVDCPGFEPRIERGIVACTDGMCQIMCV
jgi:hypothetical protein